MRMWGGKVFDAVWPLLNSAARVPVCGNATEQAQGPDRLPGFISTLLKKRIRMQGFIIFDDYGSQYPEFYQQMSEWLKDGKIKYKEHMVQGFEPYRVCRRVNILRDYPDDKIKIYP